MMVLVVFMYGYRGVYMCMVFIVSSFKINYDEIVMITRFYKCMGMDVNGYG